MEVGFILLGIVLFCLLIYICLRNRLVSLKNKVEYANGAVDAMLRQRFDLIPNLIIVVKQYMQYEKGLLEKLIALRGQAKDPNLNDKEKFGLNEQLDKTINTFNVTVEDYPVIKADKQFTLLQASLNECEGQLAAARRTYNAAVMDYNNATEMFPTNIIASRMGYGRKDMLECPKSRGMESDISE